MLVKKLVNITGNLVIQVSLTRAYFVEFKVRRRNDVAAILSFQRVGEQMRKRDSFSHAKHRAPEISFSALARLQRLSMKPFTVLRTIRVRASRPNSKTHDGFT